MPPPLGTLQFFGYQLRVYASRAVKVSCETHKTFTVKLKWSIPLEQLSLGNAEASEQVVNYMILFNHLTFTSSQSGPEGRTLRANATGPAAASRSKGSGLSFFSDDSHNLILDALGVNDNDMLNPQCATRTVK